MIFGLVMRAFLPPYTNYKLKNSLYLFDIVRIKGPRHVTAYFAIDCETEHNKIIVVFQQTYKMKNLIRGPDLKHSILNMS